MKSIVLGGGCFWCLEAVYQRVKSVEKVVSGYAGGGLSDTPTYENHSTHAEVVQLKYDENQITKTASKQLYVGQTKIYNRAIGNYCRESQ